MSTAAPGPALIWCPFASEEDAARAAGTLLDEKLVACANIMPAIRSLYEWDGERGDAHEVGVIFKTNVQLLEQAVARLEEIHPYDTPAVIGWAADGAGAATRKWLGDLSG